MRSLRAVLVAGFVAASAVLYGGPLSAQPAAVSEQALKAVLLFKLPLFVYHERTADREVVTICVLGRSGLEDALRQLAVAPIAGRRVDLRELRPGDSAQPCELVFVGRSESRALAHTLGSLQAPSAVTVSDIEGFAAAGGMVELGVRGEGEGLAIVINRAAARAQGIEFNAQLLRLARTVGD